MTITINMKETFEDKLSNEEREKSTIEKYLRDVNSFINWLGNNNFTHENCVKYKEKLLNRGLKPATINGILSALNKFL